MTEFSVSQEAYIFLCSAGGGASIFFVYDLFRILRKKAETPRLFTHIQDIIFWVIAFVIMFFLIFYVNNGTLRFYEFLGAALGALVYGFSLSGWVLKILQKCMTFFSEFFKIFLKILLTPLYFAYNILYRYVCLILRPLRRFGRFAGRRFAEKVKQAGRMMKKK